MSKEKTWHNSTRTIVTAILVDGGFYLKRAAKLFGKKSPQQRADEVVSYCMRHIGNNNSNLYRVFYYDCPPSEKVIFHPLTKKHINLGKTELYSWTNDFHKALQSKRKVAFRRGELLESQAGYFLNPDTLKKLCAERISIADLSIDDFGLDITQKGVDMRMGLDIASLAHKGTVNQIVLIAGDSDFVPAAKHARREGVDFILDPMWHGITGSLNEHIDGLQQCCPKPPHNQNDKLHISKMNEAVL